ncbi:MAG: AMP-binding protein, partial [Pseudomonadota bacterium]
QQSPETIIRTLRSLVADEVASVRSDTRIVAESLSWPTDLPLDSDEVGLDSLDVMNAASRVNQFFRLHEVGVEDYLLINRSLDEWARVVAKGLEHQFDRLTFLTSGSTGSPKPCTHEIPALLRDADFVAGRLEPRRILTLVPPHHIYGFIYTGLMPLLAGCPLVDVRFAPASRLSSMIKTGDVIVGTPFVLTAFARTLERVPSGISVLTSTAPLPTVLADQLQSMGIEQTLEVYGASETGGVGWRKASSDDFQLFPWWELTPDGLLIDVERGGDPHHPMDLLERGEGQCFSVQGRSDNALQIGGVNVFPTALAERIAEHPDVVECAVRPIDVSMGAQTRLKAFIVPGPDIDVDDLERDLVRYARSTLSAPERPVQWTFGDELPVNDLGKLQDWPI